MVGYDSFVKLLLTKGAEVEAMSQHNYTALHIAAAGGHGPVVKQLLEGGCLN